MAKISEIWLKEWVRTIGDITFEVSTTIYDNNISFDIFKTAIDQSDSRYPGYHIGMNGDDEYIKSVINGDVNEEKNEYIISFDPIFYVSGEGLTLSLSDDDTKELKEFIRCFMLPIDELREKIINEI